MSTDASETPDGPRDEHPLVDRLRRDVELGRGAKEGAAWIGLSRIGGQVFQFAVSIITARLLLPSQFGEAALVLAIISFAQIFTDLGIAAAIVQAKVLTERLLSTAFFLSLGSGVFLAVTVSLLAFPLSALYDRPSLVPLVALSSLNFIVVSSAVQTAVLERTFHFKRLAVLETSANVVGIAVVPIAAVAGAGTYSLVMGPLVQMLLLNTGLWLTVRWVPRERPSLAEVLQLWRFSRGLVGFNALNYWSRNLDTLLLGRYATTTELGQYTRSFSVTLVPVQQMSVVLNRVTYPAYARMQDDTRRLGRAWTRSVATASSVTMPVTVTLAATAPALVSVLYGPRWADMVTVLELLAISTVPQIIAGATGGAFRATGNNDLLFKLGLASSGLSVIAIVVGVPWGTVGVASALLVKSWLALPLVLIPLGKIFGSTPRALLVACVGLAWPSLVLVAGELAVRILMPGSVPAAVVLLTQLAVGGSLWLLVMWRTDSPALSAVSSFLARRRERRRASRGAAPAVSG